MSNYPYVRAAFINAIAEEGTKAEAVEFLQKQWNKSCALQDRIEALEAALRVFADPLSWRLDGSCDPNSGRFEGQSIARAALAPEQDK